MKRTTSLFIAILLSFSVNAQNVSNSKVESQSNSFKYPVLVKLIQGQGNIFRIGFLRYNDFYGIKEDANNPSNIYASFIDLADVTVGNFKDKYFVYFPLSKTNGEMLIIDKKDVTKLDMRYEQAMELIVFEDRK